MITCDLIGRLGNQMFQIATTAATAWRNGTDFALPTKAMGSYTGEVYFPNLPVVPNRIFPVYREKGHHYIPIPPMKDGKLHGYWQCEKYFNSYREQVIELFNLKPNQLPKVCSIHLRFGDYIAFKDKHPPVTHEYVQNAVDYVYEETGTYRFKVFSDDSKLAKEFMAGIGLPVPFGVSHIYEGTDPKESLMKMAGCEHNIVANSSFSWWGAWLNPNPDKIVIAPKVWFGPGNRHLSDKDIIPENWIRL